MSGLLLADSHTLSQVQSQGSTKNSRKSHFHARNDSSEELGDMAENKSGESEVSVRVHHAMGLHGGSHSLWQIKLPHRAVMSHFAQVIMRDHSVQQKRLVLLQKENTQLFAHAPYGAFIPKSGNMELTSLGRSGLCLMLIRVCISKCTPSIFVP